MSNLTVAEVKVIKSAQLVGPVEGALFAGIIGRGR